MNKYLEKVASWDEDLAKEASLIGKVRTVRKSLSRYADNVTGASVDKAKARIQHHVTQAKNFEDKRSDEFRRNASDWNHTWMQPTAKGTTYKNLRSKHLDRVDATKQHVYGNNVRDARAWTGLAAMTALSAGASYGTKKYKEHKDGKDKEDKKD